MDTDYSMDIITMITSGWWLMVIRCHYEHHNSEYRLFRKLYKNMGNTAECVMLLLLGWRSYKICMFYSEPRFYNKPRYKLQMYAPLIFFCILRQLFIKMPILCMFHTYFLIITHFLEKNYRIVYYYL